jgi:hypothetical protein
MSSPSAQSSEPTNRGIFDGFEGYRTATRDDHVVVLKKGLVAVDANVLLDLYRYGKQGRDDLIAALSAIGDRLWVPNHAMVEFWRNREGVLKDPGGTVQLVKTLVSSKDTIVKAIDLWGKQRSHPQETVEELTAEVTKTLDGIKDQVTELSKEETDTWARDTSKDEVLQALTEILEGKVGRPLSEEAYAAALTEAKRRGDEQIPPGYLDAKKPEPESAGDYLVWKQLLVEAKHRQLDILLVTRDAKDDWVRREGGEIRGPRMELIEEALIETDRRFYLRTPAQLLDLAKDALNVAVRKESVENADRLSRELTKSELLDVEDEDDLLPPEKVVEALFSYLENADPSALTALKLASVRDGMIDADVLTKLHIFPSKENLDAIDESINSAINFYVELGIFPRRTLTFLIPYLVEGRDAAYMIHPHWAVFVRRATVLPYQQEQGPGKISRIEKDLATRASVEGSFATIRHGRIMPLTRDDESKRERDLRSNQKPRKAPGDSEDPDAGSRS